MSRKPPSTMSELRRKLDWLRSEMQKPAVMRDPRRLALLKEAFEAGRKLLRAQQDDTK
jgi:hypothetical protein